MANSNMDPEKTREVVNMTWTKLFTSLKNGRKLPLKATTQSVGWNKNIMGGLMLDVLQKDSRVLITYKGPPDCRFYYIEAAVTENPGQIPTEEQKQANMARLAATAAAESAAAEEQAAIPLLPEMAKNNANNNADTPAQPEAEATPAAKRMVGIVERWVDNKSFGFIKPDDGTQDVVVFRRSLPDPRAGLTEGDEVEFEIRNFTDGKIEGINIKVCGARPTPNRGSNVCFKCGGKGHFARECRGEGVTVTTTASRPTDEPRRPNRSDDRDRDRDRLDRDRDRDRGAADRDREKARDKDRSSRDDDRRRDDRKERRKSRSKSRDRRSKSRDRKRSRDRRDKHRSKSRSRDRHHHHDDRRGGGLLDLYDPYLYADLMSVYDSSRSSHHHSDRYHPY